MRDGYQVILDDCRILEADLRKMRYAAEDGSPEYERLSEVLREVMGVGATILRAQRAASKEVRA